jgi:simple sugar transport system substrate-binding protein
MRRSSVFKKASRALCVAVAGGVAVAGLAACSGGGAPATESGQAPAGKATTAKMTFAMVTHGPPGDTF